MMFETIIIGKGAAGISAAIYLKRYNKDVLVIGKDLGALEKSVLIQNYYGFPNGIDGKELIENGIKQAQNLGIDVLNEEVIEIDMIPNGFVVNTSNNSYQSKTLLLATGKKRIQLKTPGFKNLVGKGIAFCVTCDGFFFRKKKLALIGYNDYMLSELKDMGLLTDDITIFTNGNPLTVDVGNHKVIKEPIKKFIGDDYLTGIEADQIYDLDGAFIALGTPSASDFARKIGAILEGDNIKVDENLMTNIDGLFAAGDAIGGFLQLTKASNDGMIAAMAIRNKLNDYKKAQK